MHKPTVITLAAAEVLVGAMVAFAFLALPFLLAVALVFLAAITTIFLVCSMLLSKHHHIHGVPTMPEAVSKS